MRLSNHISQYVQHVSLCSIKRMNTSVCTQNAHMSSTGLVSLYWLIHIKVCRGRQLAKTRDYCRTHLHVTHFRQWGGGKYWTLRPARSIKRKCSPPFTVLFCISRSVDTLQIKMVALAYHAMPDREQLPPRHRVTSMLHIHTDHMIVGFKWQKKNCQVWNIISGLIIK